MSGYSLPLPHIHGGCHPVHSPYDWFCLQFRQLAAAEWGSGETWSVLHPLRHLPDSGETQNYDLQKPLQESVRYSFPSPPPPPPPQQAKTIRKQTTTTTNNAHAHIHTHGDARAHTHTHTHPHTPSYTHTPLHTHTPSHPYTHTHTHTHTHPHTPTHTHTHTPSHPYPHTHTHTHGDARTHTHTHHKKTLPTIPKLWQPTSKQTKRKQPKDKQKNHLVPSWNYWRKNICDCIFIFWLALWPKMCFSSLATHTLYCVVKKKKMICIKVFSAFFLLVQLCWDIVFVKKPFVLKWGARWGGGGGGGGGEGGTWLYGSHSHACQCPWPKGHMKFF